MLKIIKELAADNMTMVVVTHEMNFARDISNRIIFLDNGKIEAQGTPDDVFSNTSNGRLREFLSSFYDK